MRTLSIEQVNNGWIVRPFTAIHGWASNTVEDIFVYRTIAELQADIPRLLSEDGPVHVTSLPVKDATSTGG